MDDKEQIKVDKPTSSSSSSSSLPKMNVDNCAADDEHVIKQNSQSLLDANVLDLTASSCATKIKEEILNENCLEAQQQQVDDEEEALQLARLSPVETPVDLRNNNINEEEINCTKNELQTEEPCNLIKMDNKPSNANSLEPLAKALIAKANSTASETENSTNSLTNIAGAQAATNQVESTQMEESNFEKQASSSEAINCDKIKEDNRLVEQHNESILDLRINNSNEDISAMMSAHKTYQADDCQPKSLQNEAVDAQHIIEKLKTVNAVEAAAAATAVQLNGSHRDSPNLNCELKLENSNIDEASSELKNKTNQGDENFVEKMSNSPTAAAAEITNEHFSTNDGKNTDSIDEKIVETVSADQNESATTDLNDSRYSSSDSLNSTSTLRSSSSHQLIIDQPAEDDKVPPLRLKLKRKHRKSSSSTESLQLTKKPSIEKDLEAAAQVENNIEMLPQTTAEILESITASTILLEAQQTKPHSSELTEKPAPLQQNSNTLKSPQPQQQTTTSTNVKYYKCTACGTYHENWNFFLHLQEKHDRFLCLYCVKCFPTAEKLALHLEIKHDLEQNHFNTEEDFRSSALILRGFALETRFLMCCTCQHIFRENTPFTEHACLELMKACTLCGQKGRHTNQCKANPMTKRRNKKKIRQKSKPPINELLTGNESTNQETSLQTLPVAVDQSLLPAPAMQPPPPQQQPARRHSEDSNSSSNMVIDETCNTRHSLPADHVNPFSALDESERLEQESSQKTANSLGNVFKLKLRVPKEFQKPVDEAITTSESEHGEDDVTELSNSQSEFKNKIVDEEITTNVNATETTLPVANTENLEATTTMPSEEESIDDTMANAQLARILQEIEQTKLDIEKTKETLQQRQQQQQQEQQEPEIDVEKCAEETQQTSQEISEMKPSGAEVAGVGEHWTPTPTPPASPLQNLSESEKAKDVMVAQAAGEETASENAATIVEPAKPASPVSDETLAVSAATPPPPPPPPPPDDGIEVANEDCLLVELQLDRPLDQFETVEFVRICLKAAYPFCLYCNHARRIAVNAENLVLHLIAQHRFMATVDSITAEELQPSTLVAKLKSYLPQLRDQFMNSHSYCTIGEGSFTRHFNERIFECFQCRFVTTTHKELYLHNRKMHLRTAILCFMCRCNFYSFSEILCHICPGLPHRVSIFDIKFRCCLCDLTDIPSPFRLMVHLRKRHFACDICLEDCRDQSKLSSHVWKHKLHHLCYRCGIAYRNKLDITKHLFWKHGTESALCKRCLQKRWPHVYHFCVPPAIFSCDVCQLCFSKAMYLTVHKRLHQQDFRYPCMEANCEEKFISRKLLLKHSKMHEPELEQLEAVKEQLKKDLEMQQADKEVVDADTAAAKTQATKAEDDLKIKEELQLVEVAKASEVKTADEHAAVATKPAETQNEQQQQQQQPNERKHSKKRRRRAKESLEDLNLTAPNLSESGSSSESDSETKSTTTAAPAATRHELALSPLSEHGEQKPTNEQTNNSGEPTVANNSNENVLDIWKNLLQAQQQQQQTNEPPPFIEYTEDDYPKPKFLHVCISDHDYCAMFAPTPASNEQKTSTPHKKSKSKLTSDGRRAPSLSSSSDASSDDSSSSSSCSCGSNCSCSNATSSSSSSGESSDSSNASGTKKRLRKKSERSSRHRKSFSSSSPLKQQQQNLNTSGEILNVTTDADVDGQAAGGDTNAAALAVAELQIEAEKAAAANEAKMNFEPSINESDLETAESETDEEYYDEHPQKLATELLSQKRAQLMARTLLSPSHNFDIVENSRPSTPSLPEDVVYEKRQKKKKTKRERKSTSKAAGTGSATNNSINELNAYLTAAAPSTQPPAVTEQNAMELQLLYNQNESKQTFETSINQQRVPLAANLAATNVANHHHHYAPRISEGSSCSDADYSLKRSKRQRRPNKFYGYTSDDESMAPAAMGQSLVIGMRAYKPLPPPQLVWDKEDLPTPDKSILNASRKTNAPTGGGGGGSDEPTSKKKKTASHRRSSQSGIKRSKKLPPIPRLKIRSALFNKSLTASDLGLDYSSDDSGSGGSDNEKKAETRKRRPLPSKHSTSTALAAASYLPRYLPNQEAQQQQTAALAAPNLPPPQQQQQLPPPPTPQTTAFNHRIPPALLPNPDFATLQYFKANNIRYPIRPPAGARAAREGESVYCYCRCPYDEVSEMIACDGDNCLIEWFHFECVGIMLAPQGKWFCAECRPQYSEELYPTTNATTSAAASQL